MTAAAQHTPGPWFVQENEGTDGWAAGFYVGRRLQSGVNEWLKDRRHRIARFTSAEQARRAAARADSFEHVRQLNATANAARSAQHTPGASQQLREAAEMLDRALRVLRSIDFGNAGPEEARAMADAIYMARHHRNGSLTDAAIAKATGSAA